MHFAALLSIVLCLGFLLMEGVEMFVMIVKVWRLNVAKWSYCGQLRNRVESICATDSGSLSFFKICKEDRTMLSLPATIKSLFSLDVLVSLYQLIFCLNDQDRPMRTWDCYCCEQQLFATSCKCEIVQGCRMAMQCVFHACLCWGFTWRQRRERNWQTPRICNFSSCHACALNPKCLWIAPSYQSMEFQSSFLTFFSHQTWYALWLYFCLFHFWWWSESCCCSSKIWSHLPLLFKQLTWQCCSSITRWCMYWHCLFQAENHASPISQGSTSTTEPREFGGSSEQHQRQPVHSLYGHRTIPGISNTLI
jgi:hypothetical protein